MPEIDLKDLLSRLERLSGNLRLTCEESEAVMDAIEVISANVRAAEAVARAHEICLKGTKPNEKMLAAAKLYNKLRESQQQLSDEFHKVLDENLFDLYVKT